MIATQARHQLGEQATFEPLLEPDAALSLRHMISQVDLATRGATHSAKLLAKAVTARYVQALELSLSESSTLAWSRFVFAVHELVSDLERSPEPAGLPSIEARGALRSIVLENADLLPTSADTAR